MMEWLLSFVVTIRLFVLSIVVSIGLYRAFFSFGDSNSFAALMIFAATSLALGLLYIGLDAVFDDRLPPLVPGGKGACPDGSLPLLSGECPCTPFDMRLDC